MGNRCVITTINKDIGVYMHWNGGLDTIGPILKFCKNKKYPSPEDDSGGWSYLITVITNTFGDDGNLVIVDILDKLDCNNYDNGVYVIKDWEIVERLYAGETEQHEYSFDKVLSFINERQPKHMQLF